MEGESTPQSVEPSEPASDTSFSSLPTQMSPVGGVPLTENAHPIINATPETAQDSLDVDEGELLQLYRRIPPPDLRAFALARAKERMTSDIARKVKDDGIFDSFRRAWLKDLETKPQFQNLIRRVEIRCSEFLKTIKWSTDLNKTQLRDKLQHFIEGLSFVDTGIRDLLQEINTGVYSNPIPIQRFEDSVARIVGEKVKQCIESSMPDFPRLRKMHGDEECLPAPPMSLPFSYRDNLYTPNGLQPEEVRRKDLRNSRSKSPDLVDMEISSPEGSAMDLDDVPLPHSMDVPDTGFSSEPPSLSPRPPVSTAQSRDDRVEGALVLLMLASGKEWGSSPPSSTNDVPSVATDEILSPSDNGEPASSVTLVEHPSSTESEPLSTHSVEHLPPDNSPGKDRLSDIMVTTEPVSAESSPRQEEPETKTEKDVVVDTKPAAPSLDALFDPIESGSDEEKPAKSAKDVKTEQKVVPDKPKEVERPPTVIAQKVVPPTTSSSSPKPVPVGPRVKPKAVVRPPEQFQSRITKISTEKLPISQAKSLKRPAAKIKVQPPKRAAIAAKKDVKPEPKPVPVKERPKFVPVITDFTLEPSTSKEEGGLQPVEKSDIPHKSDVEPPKVQAPVVKAEKRDVQEAKKADETESEASQESQVPAGSTFEARPTRQRKTNSKYCNDAFVSVPPLPKRTPSTRKSRSGEVSHTVLEAGVDESAPSPGANANVAEGGNGEGRPTNKKRKR
ncbi:proline-rich protein 36-like [Paramacrobiotus metropolitanus]|uniref:proline-rich protein 36-like n=1 Tax=Paramacrobiotus metropolitanus TaxID=2943436 RepID=UPI002445ED74|nr:proline-rich protein 36-like [Paramacrobiotus metropolitanus]XP_055348371.1 proline-rich protein 36-like [Paramacrobiotus metropolitanus]